MPLVAALALASRSSGTAVEPAAPAPSPAWEPVMAVPGTDPMPGTVAEALQGELDAWLSEAGLVGVTAAVVGADGVWSGAAGTDGAGTELVPDAALALASITKTFTAAQVMALAGEGLVNLDTPSTPTWTCRSRPAAPPCGRCSTCAAASPTTR